MEEFTKRGYNAFFNTDKGEDRKGRGDNRKGLKGRDKKRMNREDGRDGKRGKRGDWKRR